MEGTVATTLAAILSAIESVITTDRTALAEATRGGRLAVDPAAAAMRLSTSGSTPERAGAGAAKPNRPSGGRAGGAGSRLPLSSPSTKRRIVRAAGSYVRRASGPRGR